MSSVKKFLGLWCAMWVSACGQPLGEYYVEGITVVADAPAPLGVRTTDYGRYLKIELSSGTSLTAISDEIGGVYAHADFCPFSDRYFLTTFGPFSGDGADLGVPSMAEPMQPGPDGRYRYQVFIVPTHPVPGLTYSKARREREAYDLGTSGPDICLRFDAPGYDIVRSKSTTIRIPRERLTALLLSKSPPPRLP